MGIGPRLTLLLAIPMVALLALFGYLEDRRGRDRLEEELIREGRAVARTLQLSVEDYIRDRQPQEIQELVDKVSRYERILGLRIFKADGSLSLQSSNLDAYPFAFEDLLEDVLETGESREAQRDIEGIPTFSFIVSLTGPEGRCFGALQVLQLGSFLEEEARRTRTSIGLLTLTIIAALVLIIHITNHYFISRRSEELVRHVRDVGAGDLSSRVPVRSKDEFGRLAEEFNVMVQRLAEARDHLFAEQERRRKVEDALRTAQRLASVGRLAAGLAHEIGTPLNIISGRVESVRRKLAPDDALHGNLKIILGQIDRIARTVHGMLDFARSREPNLSLTELEPILRKVFEFLEQRLTEKSIKVTWEISPNLPEIRVDVDQCSQVFLNLMLNAIDAMPGGGNLTLAASKCASARPGDERADALPHLGIAFVDTGHGIPPDLLPHVFDPFFTTKEVGSGSGLGLSIVYGIVEEHGGWVEVGSEPDQGTRVTVFLPVEDSRNLEPRAPRRRE